MNNNKNCLHLKITTPLGVFFEEDIDEIVIPGSEGYFGVQYGHTPFITSIIPGILTVYYKEAQEKYSIHNGFVIVDIDKISILTEIIESPKEIDKHRAEKAKKRAERRLREKKEDTDFRRAEAALRRAVARLQSVER
ncbi:MAG: ATP synthase F1 subunit epsilon [Candidatus Cloacimonadota bacterium]|nr:ATP synthase F1 subunit epsilon [Candidatus Cloacimonadota bacterium]